MADVYTRSIATWSAPATGDVTLFTCPAGQHVVVRDLVVGNPESAAQSIFLYFYLPGLGGVWLFRESVPAQTTIHVDLRQALNPSEAIVLQGTGLFVSVMVTAYVFEDP